MTKPEATVLHIHNQLRNVETHACKFIVYSKEKLKILNNKRKSLNELVGLCGSYRVTGDFTTNMLKQ